MTINNVKVFNENGIEIPCCIENSVTVRKNDVPEGTEYIIFDIPFFNAKTGDEGYYAVADVMHRGSHLCFFTDKEDYDVTYQQDLMPIFGVKNKENTILGIVSGMRYEFYLNLGIKNGKYYLRPKFIFNGDKPYEDIKIDFYELGKDAEYSQMAQKYREIQLAKGNCIPLKERCKNNPQLEYAAESVEIRIRMGWKPAPAAILEQTVENEPEMKVACTFDRVKDLIDELKNQGVDKAQLCLVGWNISGHDGRYPDLFPVEERLGGEKKLRELITYAQNNGYQIICHTNSTDCYSISKDFSDDIVIKSKNGDLKLNGFPWSGGHMYWLCPVKAWDFAQRDLPKVADLGFKGIHYIDVMAVVSPRTCYDKNHPVTSKETVEYYNKIMELCHREFGGFSSEGCFDFAAKYLDYGLYVAWSDCEDNFFDKEIPFWQLVYHGIILSNASTVTVNYPIKGEYSHNKAIEYGSRPSFYIYSKFMEGSNNDDWLGCEDLLINTDEQLKYSVSKIKEAYDEFVGQKHLQKEFMIEHKYMNDGSRCVVYSDGTEVTVNS